MASVTVTTAANALVDRWNAELSLDPSEERVVTKNFWDADAEKIGNVLYVRKLATVAATAFVAGTSGATPTFTANTEARTAVSPVSAYNAVEIERPVVMRMLNETELRDGTRKQLMAGLDTYIDVDGANDAVNLSQTAGGAGNHFTSPIFRNAVRKLHEGGKSLVTATSPKWLIFHTSELENILGIQGITEAQITGDPGLGPTRTGYVLRAYGMELSDSGNVYQAGGLTYNLLHAKQCLILAFNERPNVLEPQIFNYVVRLLGFTEYGIAEHRDGLGVAIITDN